MYPGQNHVVIGGAMFYHDKHKKLKTPSTKHERTKTSPERKRRKIPQTIDELPSNVVVSYRHSRKNMANMNIKEICQLKENLRASLPKLNKREIRRYRLPFHEAMCLELEEDGYPDTATYIRKLIDFNEEIRESAGVGTAIWRRPLLKNNTLHLDKLCTELIKAEDARKNGNLGHECNFFLNMALFFMNKSNIWWWVAEQLFRQSVNIGSMYRVDGGRREATARYLYGKFLLKQVTNYNEARRHLLIARDMSTGKEWTVQNDLSHSVDSIYQETCLLLFQALLDLGVQVRTTDPKRSVRLCVDSLRHAVETNRLQAQTEVLLQLGMSYYSAGKVKKALDTLSEYLILSEQFNDVEGWCKAILQIAICYKALEDHENTLNYLQIFLQEAEKYQLLEFIATAHRHLGEYNLRAGSSNTASEHLTAAFSIYFQLKLINEMEQTRALVAVSAGLEVIPGLTELILNCDGTNENSLMRLVHWKDNHAPFWELDQLSASSTLVFKSQNISELSGINYYRSSSSKHSIPN